MVTRAAPGIDPPSSPLRPRPDRPAYSLVEVVMVLLVCAAVSATAVPRFGTAAARYRADYAAKRVVQDLDRARTHARLTGTAQSVTFDTTLHRYTVSGSGAGNAAAYAVDLKAGPYTAKVQTANFGGLPVVSFDTYGQPTPAAGGTVTVKVGAQVRTVTVDGGSGRATWQ